MRFGPCQSAAVASVEPVGKWDLEAALREERARVENPAEPLEYCDALYHLVQDREDIVRIEAEEFPSPEYYEQLRRALQTTFPSADPDLLDHVAAFDTASVFAMRFGVAKFQLAQQTVKLVGEFVDREWRSPNPEILRAIERWPLISTLKDLQALLGTANYVRAHAGPTYAWFTPPLRRRYENQEECSRPTRNHSRPMRR